MEKSKVIHLKEANTLSNFLTPEERFGVVSLKITGFVGRKDFDDVLDDMCDVYGLYDDDDNWIPDYEESAAIRHLDMGEATYVDGDNLPYFGYHVQLETFILPKGIKSTIDGDGFESGLSESEMLKTLVLPEGLKNVDGFWSCPNLKDVVLPEGLEGIGCHAFRGCTAITSIRIPASVKYLYGSSFSGCKIKAYEIDDKNPYFTVVDGVVFSKDLTTLVAFPSAYPHEHYVVPSTTRIIGKCAFEDSCISYVELPIGLLSIKESAFSASHIRKIEIPNTVTELGEMVFRHCYNLEHIQLSKGLSKIPRMTFSGCIKLKSLELPSSVKSICYSAIAWCDALEYLKLNNGLEEIVDEGPMLGVNGDLKEVNFPITLNKVPGGVFNYSSYIKEFNLAPDNPYFSIIDSALCSKDGKTIYSVPDFLRCSYKIPEGVEVIAERAFAFLPELHTIELPSTLRTIECRAFQGCKSLTQIQIPAGVVKVHIDALWADNLKNILMESSVPPEMNGYIRDDEWRYRDVNLFVPEESVAAYKKALGWRSFNVKAII
jgi:hypothetical protein